MRSFAQVLPESRFELPKKNSSRKDCHRSKKNERSGNLSFSQMLSIVTILLLTLIFVSSCDAPPSPNQNRVQRSGTPLPTIVAREPGNQQAFCNGSVDQTAWSGPENVRQVDSAVPPPVTAGLIGGYSVGDFNAPCIMPKVGVVRIEIFISDKMVGPVFGEGRKSDPLFDPADTKAAIILDFTKGEAQIVAAPTCHGEFTEPRLDPLGAPIIAKPDCAYAYPLSGIRGHGHNWFRWKVDPKQPGFPDGTEFLSLQYEFTNPTLRGFIGSSAQILNPAINGLIHFAFEPETGSVCLKGTVDDFPVVAVHQVHYDVDGSVSKTIKPITLARHKESEPPLIGLTDPFHWTEAHIGNQCGQSLTGSTLANPLVNVDWTHVVTQTELGCGSTTPGQVGPNLGVEVDAKQFADVTGDDNAEAFVAVACVPSTSSWPSRLEVFDGSSDPAHPKRIAKLLDYTDGPDGANGLGLRIKTISVSKRTATIISAGFLPDDGLCCPSLRITDKFTWNGSSFTRGPRSVVQMT